jgi:hypothetical protein
MRASYLFCNALAMLNGALRVHKHWPLAVCEAACTHRTQAPGLCAAPIRPSLLK